MPDSREPEFDFDPPARSFTFLDLDLENARQSDRPPISQIRRGTRFGDYEVRDKLGQGAMSVVFRGKQVSTGRPVAIKVLHERLDRKRAIRERFRREAEAVARVQHEHIIDVYLYGILKGRPFMVLELVDGGSVAELLEQRRRKKSPPSIERAVELTRMTLEALEAAHRENLLHRDVKPANLLLNKAGAIKLADFGLVKMLSSHPTKSITMTGACLGTPLYMAPEQCVEAKKVDVRSDLYSVGVTLFELLTLSLPYTQGKTPMALHALQSTTAAPRIRSLRKTIPKALDEVVAKLLSFAPQDRFPNARLARKALLAALPRPKQVQVSLYQRSKMVHTSTIGRGGKLILGRASEAGFTIDGKGLSRFHCQLELTTKGLQVMDLGSKNGTFLNEERIHVPQRVSHGDSIRLGKESAYKVSWKTLS